MQFRVKFDVDMAGDSLEEVRANLKAYLGACLAVDLLPGDFEFEEIEQ